MFNRRRLLIVLTIIILLALFVGIFVFHTLMNRPSAIMGYFEQTSNELQNTGDHFSQNGMLEVDFRYKQPSGVEHITYSLSQEGSSKPVLDSISLGTSSGPEKESWGGYRFPIAHFPKSENSRARTYIFLHFHASFVSLPLKLEKRLSMIIASPATKIMIFNFRFSILLKNLLYGAMTLLVKRRHSAIPRKMGYGIK